MIGSKLGSYEVEKEIGRGGMGVVYRARQPALRRQVAVKVLLPHLSKDAEFVERFMREARSAAKLHHPGLVTIFDVGELDGTYYFSMQWLEGKTLEEKLAEQGPLPIDEVVDIVRQMASALGYAHQKGVVHRDVKPANVIVDEAGRAVLTDFGIAQAGNETRLTRAGASVGSPDYMAPEQIQGEAIDARTDLYALGILFHHLLAGEPPYTGDAPIAVAYQHLNALVPSVREKRPEVSPALDEVVCRLMAKAPGDRFQTAEELLAALEAVPGLEVAGAPTSIGSLPISVARGDLEEPVPAVGAAERPAGPAFVKIAAALVVAAALGAAAYFGLLREPVAEEAGGSTTETAGQATPGVPAVDPTAERFSGQLSIEPDLAGLEIWLDGEDQGLRSPAVLPLEGVPGDARTVELRSEGEVVASLGLTLGPQMRRSWAPAVAPAEETIMISSQPAGALVALDGEALEGVTPLAVSLMPGREYQLAVTLDGYDPAGWSFDLDQLSAEQRESGQLHFVLEASVPPAQLVVVAGYQVTVEVAGRRRTGEGEIRLSVPPGSHKVRLSAPQVYFTDTVDVVLESEKSRTLTLPRTVTITVFAEGTCRLSIDGREVGDVPTPVELTVGTHRLRFEWEDGLVKEQRYTIGLSTQRIYEERPA